ncbi:hypothetical protein EVAR_40008_1 [Eumeta japonica]|uniref:Uncharacterized protein n=1 Tax=Eumeta variegata TaxID=151549 RepID=A0A4C2ABJ2_EUMVA|nr:hypothetical protein EVAR_40008_1 [Eumeta japonica]
MIPSLYQKSQLTVRQSVDNRAIEGINTNGATEIYNNFIELCKVCLSVGLRILTPGVNFHIVESRTTVGHGFWTSTRTKTTTRKVLLLGRLDLVRVVNLVIGCRRAKILLRGNLNRRSMFRGGGLHVESVQLPKQKTKNRSGAYRTVLNKLREIHLTGAVPSRRRAASSVKRLCAPGGRSLGGQAIDSRQSTCRSVLTASDEVFFFSHAPLEVFSSWTSKRIRLESFPENPEMG